MLKKWIAPALVLAAVGVATPPPSARAADEGIFAGTNFNGSVALTTDYVFRGISQTDSGPAIQGSLGYQHPIGIYASVWGSNVDAATISPGGLELDYSLGFSNEAAGFDYDLGGVYYNYPRAGSEADLDFFELYIGVSRTFKMSPVEPTLGVKYSYSPNFFGEDGTAHYIDGSLSLGLPMGFGLAFEVGYQTVAGDELTGHGNGMDGGNGFHYVNYRIGGSKDLLGFNLDLSYQNTTEAEFLGEDIADSRVVFTVSRSL